MLIRWLCHGNYKFTPLKIWNEGTGGAEYALCFLTEALALKGHQCQVFCDCDGFEGIYNMVEFIDIGKFNKYDKEKRSDVHVFWRVPLKIEANTGRYVFFSCDQYGAGDWVGFFKWLNPRILAISKYHAGYLKRRYPQHGSGGIKVCYIGANLPDYEGQMPKERFKFIYCSQIDRGLAHIPVIWEKILQVIPDAKLVVTGSRSLWGVPDNKAQYSYLDKLKNVTYLGAIPRSQLVHEQMTSEAMLFPSSYCENFGISVAECMAAGTIPITTANAGAIPEVVGDAGVLIELPWAGKIEDTMEIEMHKFPGVEFGPFYNVFAEQALKFLNDHAKTIEMQTKAKIRAHKLWGYAQAADRFLEVIKVD